MNMIRIGINGFGRIGRYVTRVALDSKDVEIAMVNDLSDIYTLAHLLKYDSIHRNLRYQFKIEKDNLIFENGKVIKFISSPHPGNIDWESSKVDFIIESTGKFVTKELASQHRITSNQKIIISAPTISLDIPTIVLGVNEHILDGSERIISNASCTTNNAAPMIKVMKELCTIEGCFISTVHSYTTDQHLHDSPHKDLRRARAAAQSIVPTSTGAAKAIVHVFPELKDRLGGGSVRVPVADGSLTEITIFTEDKLTIEQINQAMKLASESSLKGILAYTEDPIVSVDILGNSHSCIFDSKLTSIVGKMIKIVGWYDNEAGYSNRLIDTAKYLYHKI
ncbi:MAG: type I glyceraldehyde-3-phosphate dehydrogenase [Bacteroidetes bacterium]|nr:type I glyceraldehyde-3-phosphate dehydrogenase [Bacteroidota bacterium]